MSINFETNGAALLADVRQSSRKAVRRLAVIVPEAAIDVRDEWRDNAAESAGPHGKRYPSSIRYRMNGPLEAIVAPQEDMKQGAMSFEFGSANQPPHLDGQRAIDRLARAIERRFETALDVF